VTKFLFLQGKRSKAIYGELSGVLGEAVVRLAVVKRWCRRFKDGTFSFDDRIRSRRRHSDIGEAISQFLSKPRFLSARGLSKRLAASLYTIKEILTCNRGMKKVTQRWVCDDLRAREKSKRVVDARMVSQTLRNDQSENYLQIMTGDES
jgi:hypothetical protein